MSVRPHVEVRAPAELFAGREVTVEVRITVEEETQIDFVDVSIAGRQGWELWEWGEPRKSNRVEYPDLTQRARQAGALPAGTTTLNVRFAIPADTPPSHQMSPAWATFELRVHIGTPWRRDGRYRFALQVRTPSEGPFEHTPVTIARARDSVPQLEVGLASRHLLIGETARGSLSLSGALDGRVVKLTLVSSLHLHGDGRPIVRSGVPHALPVEIIDRSRRAISFAFTIPTIIPPSFKAQSHELSWRLIVTVGSMITDDRLDVTIPLEIIDSFVARDTTDRALPPLVGDERIAAAFQSFAASSGWTRVPATDPEVTDEYVVERRLGELTLRIGYANRGKQGAFLVAQLAYPSLGLGLYARATSVIRDLFTRDVEIELEAFDRSHHITARDPAQAIPVLQLAAPSVMNAISKLGPVVSWNDDALRMERPITALVNADLTQASEMLEALGKVFPHVLSTVQPPPGVAVDLAAWRAVADRWNGRFTVGDVSITGQLDGQPVRAGLEWEDSGQPKGIRVHVGDPMHASALTRRVRVAIASPCSDPCPELQLAEPLSRWPAAFVNLEISDGTASASCSLAGSVADARRARELGEALRAVLAVLDPGVGPYR